ncbi:MAG: hypothetical protein ACRD0D_15575, partial [Acidimicrobiales bacterium]
MARPGEGRPLPSRRHRATRRRRPGTEGQDPPERPMNPALGHHCRMPVVVAALDKFRGTVTA